MKRLHLLLLTTVLLTSATSCRLIRVEPNGYQSLVGTSNQLPELSNTTHTFTVPNLSSFHGIEATQQIEVRVVGGKGHPQVQVETNVRKRNDFNIRVADGHLIVAYRKGISINERVKTIVTISGIDPGKLNSYEASTAALITAANFYRPGDLDVDVSSAGHVRLSDFECYDLSVDVSSAATATLDHFSARKADVDASSAAKALLMRASLGQLSGEASSAASINLSGTLTKGKLNASSGAGIEAAQLRTEEMGAAASSGASITVNARQLQSSAVAGGSVHNVFYKSK